ncbi:hypothetical protein [Sulfuricystis multivorans]|uniref:hypothetical protein n=1 Tax=Sulfuricystis multivorans TaxID=2211108 RepID=UPI000F831203|nr:hypothetical protein [Sulfuricystis multivorans]
MDARSIEVLQRDSGYLRLRLPAACRSAQVGAMLESGLSVLAGIERITWLTVEGKLAIRFDPQRLTHAEIARRIKMLVADLPETAPAAVAAAEPAPGLAERLGDLRERLIAAAPARFRPLVETATTEKALTNFANDIVAFYLIKVHWDLIVNRWIKDPVKYANAWLTVFYLVFLLVRYRKT